MQWKACFIGMASLALLSGGVAFGIRSENHALLAELQRDQTTLAQQGWTLAWSSATPHGSLLASRLTLADLRLSGSIGPDRLSYGCNSVTLSAIRFSSRVTARFGATHALLLAHGSYPDLALRFTGTGITLAVHSPSSREPEASLTIPAAHAEIASFPSLDIPTPFSLDVKTLTSTARWHPGSDTTQPLLTTDTTIAHLALPQPIPGLGNILDSVRIALSTSDFPETAGQKKVPITTLHLGEAHLGPGSISLTGKLVWQPDPVGDFDLTLRGMDRAVRQMATSGTVSPEIGQFAAMLGRINDIAHTGGPYSHAPDENSQNENPNSMPVTETAISVPVRLRAGAWSIGTLPLASLIQWSGSMMTRKNP